MSKTSLLYKSEVHTYPNRGHLLEDCLLEGVPTYVVSEHADEVLLYFLSPFNVSFVRASLLRYCAGMERDTIYI